MSTPSNKEVGLLASSIVFGVWSMAAINSYLEHGTVYLRTSLTGFFAVVVIASLILTSVLLGFQYFQLRKEREEG